MKREALLEYLEKMLRCRQYKDFTVNGLQVAGTPDIQRVVTAVTASSAAIEFARTRQADALLVHHGYFWKGEAPQVTGIKKKRLAALLKNDINLLAYHLPLDQHEALGNNRLLGELFPLRQYWQSHSEPLIWHAEIEPTTPQQIAEILRRNLPTETLFLISNTPDAKCSRIAWCSGAANDFLTQAYEEGAELFISGEYAERNYHEAKELGCTFIACGHHASERAGIRALGEHIAEQFDLEVTFFDEPNPF